ncbi:MAG: aldehyde ferredoxin oxidoreductase family protein [Thermodesulfobacteriota bacterium]
MPEKLLTVDLSAGRLGAEDVRAEDLRLYLGGSALAARLFFEAGGYLAEPLSPENPLVLMTGPLVGTTFPGSSRLVLCARSPLTGFWGESSSGGTFGARLRRAGWLGLRITGRAADPAYLLVEDQAATLEPARDLWGRDAYEVVDILGERHGKSASVLCIGPAGENLVKFASVCNDKAHHFGRTGLGAVLGAKNLKAVVAVGTGQVPPADAAAFDQARNAALAAIKDSMIRDSFHELGTAAAMDLGMMTGDVPIKNWSVGVDYALGEALGGPTMREKMVKGRLACYACPIGCKPVVEVDQGRYQVPRGPGPEYETVAAFGAMLLGDDLSAVAKANELCNRLGLDTITCGATIAFIIEAREKGLLSSADVDGLDLAWGNLEAALELVERIARRRGFGGPAAEGSAALARRLGPAAGEFLVTVKNLELPMHDPRAFHGQGLAYMTSTRGACHLQHSDQAIEQGMVAWPELGLKEDYPAQSSEGKAELVKISEDIGQTANALCVCHFVHWAMGNQNLLDGFNAAAGLGFTLEDLTRAGARAWVLKRTLNNLMGVTEKDDRLPPRVLTPLEDGGAAGSVPDQDLMKREYYLRRGLDDKGRPTLETLAVLDLAYLGPHLHG